MCAPGTYRRSFSFMVGGSMSSPVDLVGLAGVIFTEGVALMADLQRTLQCTMGNLGLPGASNKGLAVGDLEGDCDSLGVWDSTGELGGEQDNLMGDIWGEVEVLHRGDMRGSGKKEAVRSSQLEEE